jgi:hypothetical protein
MVLFIIMNCIKSDKSENKNMHYYTHVCNSYIHTKYGHPGSRFAYYCEDYNQSLLYAHKTKETRRLSTFTFIPLR